MTAGLPALSPVIILEVVAESKSYNLAHSPAQQNEQRGRAAGRIPDPNIITIKSI